MSALSSFLKPQNGKTTQTSVPWSAAQPYIQKGMATAGSLLKKGVGFTAPKFQTWAPMSSQTRGGLNSIWNQAQGGNPLAGQSQAAVSGILSGATNQKYNDLYASADNPHWEQAVQDQSNHIADDVQRQFGGLGRTGSAADTGALVNQLGEYRTGALASHWDQNIANQRGILGDQTQSQLGAVAAAPGAYNQRFLPGQAMGQVGAAYDDLAARKLQSQVDKSNTNSQAPWNRLNAYNAAISGNTQGTGSTTSSVQAPWNPFGAVAGGVLGAASLANQAMGSGWLSKL